MRTEQQQTPMEIAIIGLAGQFPEARDIEAFYRNLKEGRDSIRPLSLSRIWDTSLSPAKKYKKIAFLEDIDKFDYRFFNILSSEAECMAPQHRILLQLAYAAIENAGYSPDELNGTRAAVYMASNLSDYHRLAEEFNPTLLTGNIPSCIAGRIARVFNFTGNAVQIDTACSSSLVALHMACQDILSGDVKMALCGGVNILVAPPVDEKADQNGITSKQGRCLTFSDQADGAGVGEGAACVLLRPLQDAIQDKDNILAVIKASAINQDAARSSTLTAPSSIAQSEVIAMAFQKASIDPSTISYIEAHGTGTKLGDPIEIEGLTGAFRQYTSRRQFCAISALKSNIGHCDAAAGILGLAKVLLSLQKKALFPSLHIKDINPYIDFLDSPLYPNLEYRTWESSYPRRAGISAFGISGTNCHVILEEWTPPPMPEEIKRPYLFLLSGHTPAALLNNARALQDFVAQHEDISLESISYTLNTGRKIFPFRVSIVASSHDELIRQLSAIELREKPLNTLPDIWFLFTESVPEAKAFIDELAMHFPAYAKALDACSSIGTDIDPARSMDYTFGYCFSAFLKDLGLDITRVMGIGNGRDIAQVVAGKALLGSLATAGTTRKDPATPRWREFIQQRTNSKKSLIWELSIGGQRYRELLPFQDQDHVFDAVNPTETASLAALLSFIGHLAESGFTLNYRALYARIPYKTALPAYQFEDLHCWVHHPEKDPVHPWVHQLTWQSISDPVSAPSAIHKDKLFVIHCDKTDIGTALGAKLRDNGYHTCMVGQGSAFSMQPNGDLSFDWMDEPSYDQLFTSLASRQPNDLFHIHLGSCSGKGIRSSDQRLTDGLYPVLLLAKTMSRQQGQQTIKAITDTAVAISATEKILDPAGGALHGFIAGIRADIPGLDASCIDIDSKEDPDTLIDTLYHELLLTGSEPVTGLRNGHRYKKGWGRPVAQGALPLEDGGVYLITGGSSGIGLQVLKALSYCKATFIVIGRRQLPHRSFWEFVTKTSHPEHHETIRGFLRAEENNASIAYFSADVSDMERMKQVFDIVRERWGPVKGIIHAAGVGGTQRIQRHTIDSFQETLLPKVQGALNLYALADKQALKFFISFSSHNAIIAAERESNYSAANAFLDSFSAQLNKEGIIGMTIRWSFWKETGMGWRMRPYDDFTVAPERSLSNREGIDVFDHLLRQGYTDVLIAKKDPAAFLSGQQPSFQRKKQLPANVSPASADSLDDIVTAIWQKVLSRPQLSPDDNFFQFGGHSLLGLQVRNQIEKRIGIKLEYRDIVEHPTIHSLTAFLRERDIPGHEKTDEISPADKRDRYPLSEGQKGIWIASQKEQNRSLYNISLEFRLHHPADIAILRSATGYLMQRHDLLRTGFFEEEDAVYQSVLPLEDTGIPVEYIPEDAPWSWDMGRRHSFDLDKAPLFKLWLVKQNQQECALLIAMHHIIVDGWSVHIFIRQLFSYYDQLLKGIQPTLPTSALQYKDYVLWENKQLSGSSVELSQQFWKDYLKDLPQPLDLPIDLPRSPIRLGNGYNHRFTLSRAHSAGIGQLATRDGGGRFAVCLTLLQILLYRYSGQEDFFIGTPSTLRNRKELEDQIGYYVNMLPLRCHVSGDDTFDTLFTKTCQTFRAVQDHQLYPFHRMVRDAGIRQMPGRHYLFDIIFSYEYQIGGRPAAKKKTTSREALGTDSTVNKYDIEFILKEAEDGIYGIITYDADLFNKETIAQLAGHFVQLVDAVTLNCRIDRFHFESESEPSFSPSTAMEDMPFEFE